MSSGCSLRLGQKKKTWTYDTESTPNRKFPSLDIYDISSATWREAIGGGPICGHQFCTIRFKIVGGPIELGYNDICAWKWYSTRGCTILVKAMQSLHVKRTLKRVKVWVWSQRERTKTRSSQRLKAGVWNLHTEAQVNYGFCFVFVYVFRLLHYPGLGYSGVDIIWLILVVFVFVR